MKRRQTEEIPMHHHSELSDTGVLAKIVTMNDIGFHPVEYVHRDDYYIFGMMIRGSLCCDIDFNTTVVREGELQFISPGQIHRFISGDDFEGWMLIADNSLIGETYKHIFDRLLFRSTVTKASIPEMEELQAIFSIIRNRIHNKADNAVVRNLVSAFIGLFANQFQESCSGQADYSERRVELIISLRRLLDSDLPISHTPSYYAAKLNISTVYLNEIVHSVLGLSTREFIRNEIILRSKRLLYHSGMTVKQIADTLGFEDNAYFTRLFTKATGMSPLKFREHH